MTNEIDLFKAKVNENIKSLAADIELQKQSKSWLNAAALNGY